MKNIFFVLFYILLSFTFVNADSNYESDYTLIDCVNGDNDTGISFDSSMPYATLKKGIENTISYINTNINKTGNEESASGVTFNIKVQCSFNDIFNQSIDLNFKGVDYNNELVIEGIDDNSMIFNEIDFQLANNAGNIVFKNAQFKNENKPYFYDYIYPTNNSTAYHPYSSGIKLIDSSIQLKNGNNIGEYIKYKVFKSKYRNPRTGYTRYYYDYHYNYVNHFIENSIINIEIDNNYNFRMPVFTKNTKINFENKTGSGTFDIIFSENGNTKTATNLNYSLLVSNEIDLGGNNLIIENTDQIALINNNIKNLDNLTITGSTVLINNYFGNKNSLNISSMKELYNNIFKTGYTDTYDIMNYRKNYVEGNVLGKGIGWIYKRLRDNKYFNIDISVDSLYKEVTGNDLPGGLGEIYVIFNY